MNKSINAIISTTESQSILTTLGTAANRGIGKRQLAQAGQNKNSSGLLFSVCTVWAPNL